MSMIHFSIEHGRDLAEAKLRLADAVTEVRAKMGSLVERTTWSDGDTKVLIAGKGFEVTLQVDARTVQVDGDLPWVAKLLGNPLVAGIKHAIEQKFQPKLTADKPSEPKR